MQHIHQFIDSEQHPDYEACTICGSFHSKSPVDPNILYQDEYWSEKWGHSTPDDQCNNLTESESCGISKLDKVISLVPKGRNILEIGCFPGLIMGRLLELGYNCVGIEPCPEYNSYIGNRAKEALIQNGYFPQCTTAYTTAMFDTVLAIDIVEHIEDYKSFIKEVWRLLVPGGVFIMMSPIIYNGEYRDRDFFPQEHLWLFQYEYINWYLKTVFRSVKFDRWQTGHEIFICSK